jgi:hypothetical protein
MACLYRCKKLAEAEVSDERNKLISVVNVCVKVNCNSNELKECNVYLRDL